ncbi:S8 family serine peptidase [Pseudoalteromonas sp. T1lg48]|uniref:S8 family serine peptidase n=1 Tax=Pseudoalteromonas sp. T1lg48 TaxID=2077100 RepID=UPI000CF66F24|nr:S8 family serine peptidase [Pseudoalteromonas sp. T1lg48]
MQSFNRLLLSLLFALVYTHALASPGAVVVPGSHDIPAYAPDRVLVKFKPGTKANEIGQMAAMAGGSQVRVLSPLNVHVIEVPVGSVGKSIKMFSNNPNVVYAEPDHYRVLLIPDEGQDPPPTGTDNQWFNEQWGLNNTGQLLMNPETGQQEFVGRVDADIDAPEGWDISTGSNQVKIAILDTGVDCRTAARPGGSLEFIAPGKCIEEVSFVADYSTTLDDVAAHGSHVAGIAAAATNNDIGIAGVGWNSAVGNLKTCFEYTIDLMPPLGIYVIVGVCPVSSSAAAITYAADNGYHVINMSYASDSVDENGDPAGLGGWTQTESDAVDYAWSKGTVLIAAAGNDGVNTLTYPAAYDPVLAVGATERNDDRASFSNFGNWISMMAPGDHIISTVPNELCVFYAEILGTIFDPDNDACLDWYSGTSMASPHVAGAAAMVWAHFYSDGLADPATCEAAPGVPCNQAVREHLEQGADISGAGGQNMQAWSQHGRLNLAGALSASSNPQPPLTPGNFIVADGVNGTAQLSWNDVSGESGYELQREKAHKKLAGVWQSSTSIGPISADQTAIVDASGTGTFRYRLRAFNNSGASSWSSWVSVEVTESGGGSGGDKPCRGKKCSN